MDRYKEEIKKKKKITIKKIISREAHLVTCSHLSVTYESV